MENKKAQAQSIIIFFGLIVAVFIVSIIVLRMTSVIITPFQSQIGNFSAPAGEAIGYAHDKFTNVWDWAIVLLFLLSTILLLVSAFMVDIHPAFVLIYIFAVLFLVIFGNMALNALDNIWYYVGGNAGDVGYVPESSVPLQIFILNNFMIIMLGIIVLSGIVMYAKFKLFGGMGAGGNS